MKFLTANVLGFNFLQTTKAQFLEQLHTDLAAHQNRFVVTANPEIIMYAKKHPAYAEIIRQADYLVADGIGVVKATQHTAHPLPERVTGYELFEELLRWGDAHHSRIYFLGSKPAVIAQVIAKVNRQYPHVEVAGHHDGYFTDFAPIQTEIEQTQPEMVFVATGFPKQEELIQKYRHLSPAIWMGIGGSFDVFAGEVKRAPEFWQKHNLEWLYRLISDPRRIKRQIVLPIFMVKAWWANRK